MDRFTENRRIGQLLYWRSAAARLKHERLLPPMSATEKRRYKNLRRKGIDREEAISFVLEKEAA